MICIIDHENMDSHITGTLKSWNADRGFGFITPVNGGDDIFVHISDFPRQGGQPLIGETLLFGIALNREGKKKAVRVLRARNKPPVQALKQTAYKQEYTERRPKGRPFGKLTGLIFLISLAVFGYQTLFGRSPAASVQNDSETSVSVNPVRSAPASPVASRRCDGRTHCSQMTSCAEAKFFLANCPGVKMDGNNDGIPCEQQWCTSPFAK